jgi:outer membrane receptor for ferrienterochelin and colicins
MPCFLQAQTDTANVNQLLRLSLEELMNIQVVTASGYLQTTDEAPSTIQVVTAEQITERGYEQLDDVLRDIPGIDMIHINGYAPTLIYFRGMYGAENLRALLMIDGIVENNILGSNDMAGPAYSLHNVLRIEIIRGPASALYGANAFGGVINIITKKGKDVNGLYAEKGYGSFNTAVEKINVGVRRGKFEFAVSGSLYSSDGPTFNNRDPYYTGSYVDKAYSFNGSMSYYSKKTKTTAGFRTYKTPMGWGTYSNSPTVYLGLPPQGNNNVGVIGVLSSDIRGEKSGLHDPFLRTLFIENEYKPNEKLSILARLVYRETGSGEDSYIYVTVDGRKLIRGKIGTYSNRVAGELAANYSLSAKHKFSAGIQFNQDNVEQGARQSTSDPAVFVVDGKDSVTNLRSVFLPRVFDLRNNFGSYLQYILHTSFLGKTNFTFGLRYDHNSYFGDAVSPRIAIVNKPNDKLTFKLQFGKAFRAPTNLEIHQANLNFQLTTEKIKTYEINAIYMVNKKMHLEINGFRNELSDVIVLGNLTGLNPDKNPGVIKVNGVEASLNIDLTKKIYSFLNFTYQHAAGENLITHVTGKIPGIADVKANAGITAHVSNLFTAALIGNWVGERHAQRTNPYGDAGSYFLTNLTLSSKPLFNDRVTVSVAVHNLFNVKWLDPGFRTADGLLYATVLEQPGVNGLFKVCLSLN